MSEYDYELWGHSRRSEPATRGDVDDVRGSISGARKQIEELQAYHRGTNQTLREIYRRVELAVALSAVAAVTAIASRCT